MTAADLIVDASVLAKFFFDEPGSADARAVITSGRVLAAPDLVLAEIASVATTYVRRGLIGRQLAWEAVVTCTDLLDEIVGIQPLRTRALALAIEASLSAYDGFYIALAEELGAPVVTADRRLLVRAREAGLGRLVSSLS